ncbi:MAG: alpha/beta hydrolase family protein, partial [Phycisphaeraceae bacterium]
MQRERCELQRLLIRPEDGIVLPAIVMRPRRPAGDVIVYLNDTGFAPAVAARGELERWAEAGHTVFAVDLRGLGQTQGHWPLNHERFGVDGKEQRLAYLMGCSYLGMRVKDLLVVGCVARQIGGAAASLRLEAHGDIVSVVGLHAAALERELFTRVRLLGEIESFVRIVERPLAPD